MLLSRVLESINAIGMLDGSVLVRTRTLHDQMSANLANGLLLPYHFEEFILRFLFYMVNLYLVLVSVYTHIRNTRLKSP